MNKNIKIIIILSITLLVIISIIVIFYIKNNSIYKNERLLEIEKNEVIIEENITPDIEDEKIKDVEKEIINKDKIILSICPTPKKEYDDMFLFNIGQTIELPDETYIPKDLIELDTNISTRKNICLIQEAVNAFELMAQNALENGNIIKVSSGFRSYEYQNNLIINAIKSGKIDTDISIAKAGYSEHQLGTAIDITGASINYISATEAFDGTPEELWLRDNAYLYGFIQSYPKGKEDITGYKYEPWHYRYVGVDNAQEIKKLDLTIIEFLK